MTTFLLIRHGSHDLLGKTLAGRAPDVHLNARGKLEAERLAERLMHVPVKAIYSGPLERSQETAWPLAMRLMLGLRIHEGFDEINFGSWTSKEFVNLESDAGWMRWNSHRDLADTPGGETMLQAQQRIVAALDRLSTQHQSEHIAIISHCDVIKSAILHYLGSPLDRIHQLEVGPASVCALEVEGGFGKVLLLNETGEFLAAGTHERRSASR